jgi:hypothetical protein
VHTAHACSRPRGRTRINASTKTYRDVAIELLVEFSRPWSRYQPVPEHCQKVSGEGLSCRRWSLGFGFGVESRLGSRGSSRDEESSGLGHQVPVPLPLLRFVTLSQDPHEHHTHRNNKTYDGMAAPSPKTDPPHWFWRGVQSAIFYYVSCTPIVEFQHKKQRRKEAKLAQKEVVTQQPGLIQQPRAFQTNPQWTEEVLLGPGPPKGWEPHAFVRESKKRSKRQTSDRKSDEQPEPPRRPSYEHRISSALENVKGTLRSSLHPEHWNWKRYDREDEWLGGFSNTMTRMWDKMATSVGHGNEENGPGQSLKRTKTDESDKIDYTRGHIPAVNDLHPPVVSQLPTRSEEVAWMILPPPSRAVMEGKKPPMEETAPRKPLCVIGRPPPVQPKHVRTRTIDDMSVQTEDIEVWDATSVDSEDSTTATPPPTRLEVKKRSPNMFDTLSDTEMFKVRPTPRSRPASWQFHYVIPSPLPSPPAPVHVQ